MTVELTYRLHVKTEDRIEALAHVIELLESDDTTLESVIGRVPQEIRVREEATA